jgi:hypothetical protein
MTWRGHWAALNHRGTHERLCIEKILIISRLSVCHGKYLCRTCWQSCIRTCKLAARGVLTVPASAQASNYDIHVNHQQSSPKINMQLAVFLPGRLVINF